MQKLQDIDNRVELFLNLIENDSQNPSASYIAQALFCHNYCFEIMIELDEFKHLLLNSHAQDSKSCLQPYEFPTLQEVISQIKARPQFFEETRVDGGLSGSLVKSKLHNMGTTSNIIGSVLQDKWSDMTQDGTFYIIDGMHRLVAYALFTDFNPNKFPITSYLCTNYLV